MVTTPIKNFLSRVKTCLSSLAPACSPLAMSYHMTLNCMGTSKHPSHAHGPHDCLTIRMDDTMNCASLQTCPDLDPLSSIDSTQTHDSLATPESPHHLPSPAESLEEGTTEGVTQVRTNDLATQVRTNDSLAYDSLVTALSWLSLEPNPDPLSGSSVILLRSHYDSTS